MTEANKQWMRSWYYFCAISGWIHTTTHVHARWENFWRILILLRRVVHTPWQGLWCSPARGRRSHRPAGTPPAGTVVSAAREADDHQPEDLCDNDQMHIIANGIAAWSSFPSLVPRCIIIPRQHRVLVDEVGFTNTIFTLAGSVYHIRSLSTCASLSARLIIDTNYCALVLDLGLSCCTWDARHNGHPKTEMGWAHTSNQSHIHWPSGERYSIPAYMEERQQYKHCNVSNCRHTN